MKRVTALAFVLMTGCGVPLAPHMTATEVDHEVRLFTWRRARVWARELERVPFRGNLSDSDVLKTLYDLDACLAEKELRIHVFCSPLIYHQAPGPDTPEACAEAWVSDECRAEHVSLAAKLREHAARSSKR
jgi:hypothetical protein